MGGSAYSRTGNPQPHWLHMIKPHFVLFSELQEKPRTQGLQAKLRMQARMSVCSHRLVLRTLHCDDMLVCLQKDRTSLDFRNATHIFVFLVFACLHVRSSTVGWVGHTIGFRHLWWWVHVTFCIDISTHVTFCIESSIFNTRLFGQHLTRAHGQHASSCK